jgi:hypothetical protein
MQERPARLPVAGLFLWAERGATENTEDTEKSKEEMEMSS